MSSMRVSKKELPPPPLEIPVPGISEEELAPCLGLLRVLGERGQLLVPEAELPKLDAQAMQRLFETMVLLRQLDERLAGLQKQHRIGYYAEARGQEAATCGSAFALEPRDFVVPAFREAGAALLRGLPLRAYIAQVFGNENDPCKGRQLPCHPASPELHHVTMSTCVATQLPHATGIAWAAKLRKDPVVVLAYLGEGATSTEEFHVALNFAGVYKVPVVFVCQNNQWARSTPVASQTASQTIAVKALAYGLPGLRVDGNDVLAVYKATSEAVARARSGQGATFIEAVTYRMGAHAMPEDADPALYRDERVTDEWKRKDPIERFSRYLAGANLVDEVRQAALRQRAAAAIGEAITAEEGVPPPAAASLVDDVFAEVPVSLAEQLAEARSHKGK